MAGSRAWLSKLHTLLTRSAVAWSLALLWTTAACSPPAATAGCTSDKDCAAGLICQQAVCVPKSQVACDSDSQCKDALASGDWKAGSLSTCQTPRCVAKVCTVVAESVGASCDDGDDKACTVGQCNADAQCVGGSGLASGTCLIDGVCHSSGTTESKQGDGSCRVCDPSQSGTAWSLVKAGTGCGADDLPCTFDSCSASGTCQHLAGLDSCIIAGACVASGTLDPANSCRSCDPAVLSTDWSPLPKGTACQSDGLACTSESCDGAGSCKVSGISAGTCLLQDGEGKAKCVADGASVEPANACLVCVSAVSQEKPTAVSDGAPCQAGAACLVGACKAGSCEKTKIADGFCYLAEAKTCLASGTIDGNNPCMVCDPALSSTTFSPAAKTTACKADGVGCTDDRCDGQGGCSAQPQDDACPPLSAPCLRPACDAVAGCISLPKDATAPCEGSDGVACTQETCDGKGSCIASGKPIAALCNDNIACTIDACDAVKGCLHAPDTSLCADGNACTQDLCDANKGCSNPPLSDGTACSADSLGCTSEACSGGSCKVTIATNACAIGGQCVSDGGSSDGGCKTCVPAKSQTAWQLAAKASACDSDGVGCTLDTCDAAGSCTHTPQPAKCNDGLPCTADSCDVAKDCQFIDACPWGHACDASAKACLTESGKPWELVQTSAEDPLPTHPAVVRHTLDAAAGTARTWVVWQSDSCATPSGATWALNKPARLRTIALDPQLAAKGSKVKPVVTTLPTASLWGSSATVCQTFATVANDPQVAGQAWLAWLEADPAQGEAKGCISAGGQGGVLRLARLSGGSGAAKIEAAGEVCTKAATNGPLFMTQGLALLDGDANSAIDVLKRTTLSLRSFGANYGEWTSTLDLRKSQAMGSVSGLPLGSLSPFAKIHPVLVDFAATAADASSRYLALAVTEKLGKFALWATPLGSDGSDGSPVAWTAAGPTASVLAGAAAVCGLDAAVDAAGTLGVVLVTRKDGKDVASLITRTKGGVESVTTLPTQTSEGVDCRIGLAAARLTAGKAGWLVQLYATSTPDNPFSGKAELYQVSGASQVKLSSLSVATTDITSGSGTALALAWRGLSGVHSGELGTLVTAVETTDINKVRRVSVYTFKP